MTPVSIDQLRSCHYSSTVYRLTSGVTVSTIFLNHVLCYMVISVTVCFCWSYDTLLVVNDCALFVVVCRLYPVDETRVNEFGQSFEGDAAATNDGKQKPSSAVGDTKSNQ